MSFKTNDIVKYKNEDLPLFRVWSCDPETDVIALGKIGDHKSFFETNITKANELFEKVGDKK